MKLIIAIIRAECLDEVRQSLIDKEISRITLSRCSGHGRQEDIELYRGQEVTPDLQPKVRLEIAVNDDFVDRTVAAIKKSAVTGEREQGKKGDGKIFIVPLDNVIRLSTEEEGPSAI